MGNENSDGGGDSLRDALDAAFEQHSDPGNSGADAPAAAPAPTAPTAPAPAPGAPEEGQPVRDASGRFAPKTGAPSAQGLEGAQAPAPAPGQGAAPMPPAPQPAELKAPASWTPAAREKWAGIDPDIRAEIHRREGEAQRVLQQSAQHRQFVDAFENITRPYEMFIRAENSNPLQAVQNLMQTAAEFRVGTPARKVELVAGIIRNFGIDLEALDSALAAQVNGQTAQHQQPQQFRDPRLDQFLAAQAQQQQQAQQQAAAGVAQEIEAFGAQKEFFGDVAPLMGDVLTLAAKRGEALTLEQAYSRACNLHPEVSKIVAQRAATARPAAPSPAVLRAKRAASSVRNDGAPNEGSTVPKNDSIRASIEAAFDQVGDA